MKKITTLIVILLTIVLSSNAQPPQAMKYKAIARDDRGHLLVNQFVDIKISILQGSETGIPVYSEEHSLRTTLFGVMELEIGRGDSQTGDFAAIDWGADDFYIKVEMDPSGHGHCTIVGTAQLLSVPYAFYAGSAGNNNDADADPENELISNVVLSGTILEITEGGTLTLVDLSGLLEGVQDDDPDPTNELQDISLDGSNLSITEGSTVDLSTLPDNVDDADADPANEIQDLQLTGNILTITKNGAATQIDLSVFLDNTDNQQLIIADHELSIEGGNSVTLPDNIEDADADPQNELQDLILTDNSLSISGDLTPADLSPYLDDTDTHLTEEEVDAFVANNGYLTEEADGDPENEIQTISLNGNSLVLTNGGSVVLPTGSMVGGQFYFADKDKDGFGDNLYVVFVPQGVDAPTGFVTNNTDCNDMDASIHPGVDEMIGDSIDNNCDETTDEMNPEYIGDWMLYEPIIYVNSGFTFTRFQILKNGADNIIRLFTISNSSMHTLPITGTDDQLRCFFQNGLPPYDPNYEEYTILMHNLDAETIEGSIYYIHKFEDENGQLFAFTASKIAQIMDNDNDGYNYYIDCDDNNAAIYPGANEICGDYIDQDCNGSDEECVYDGSIDDDGDGFTEDEGDCNDSRSDTYPGAAEICGDGIDQDCDGIDIECGPLTSDDDGDGFSEFYGDCDDSEASIYPNAPEICNDGIDQNCSGSDQEVCSITDIDGNTYPIIEIGDQYWMAENLRVTRYNNGDMIGTTDPATLDISIKAEPKYQWAYSGDDNYVPVFGRLYTLYSVLDDRKICPTGWHVPSNEEFKDLFHNVGGGSKIIGDGGFYSGGNKLKESGTEHWLAPNSESTNESGFTALPGGSRETVIGENNDFFDLRKTGSIWSSYQGLVQNGLGYTLFLYYDKSSALLNASYANYGRSVRCIKDE